jgi:hypothetical protein
MLDLIADSQALRNQISDIAQQTRFLGGGSSALAPRKVPVVPVIPIGKARHAIVFPGAVFPSWLGNANVASGLPLQRVRLLETAQGYLECPT